MKQVSIQDLKAHLSAWVEEAASGVSIVVTKHNRPVAVLSSAHQVQLRVGRFAGKGRIRPLLMSATKGRYLKILSEDRGAEEKDR